MKQQDDDAERRARRRERKEKPTKMLPVVTDPSVPPGEMHVQQNGRTAGKITGLASEPTAENRE